jgi:hypothetical protein
VHILILPTGEGMRVLVSQVQSPRTADDYGDYHYTLTVVEVLD